MAGRRKQFTCGHIGKGQYCHRCEAEELQHQKELLAKRNWEAKLSSSPVPLEGFPRAVAEKTLSIVDALERGQSHFDFRGKRFVSMGQRSIISIPVGRRYRLICEDQGDRLHYKELITHETYNNRLSSGGWET